MRTASSSTTPTSGTPSSIRSSSPPAWWLIALPLGAALAFLLTRTDLPGQRVIEVLVLIPVFVSPMVLAFGYVVSMGPVGFYSLWAKDLLGDVPWNVYSLASIARDRRADARSARVPATRPRR